MAKIKDEESITISIPQDFDKIFKVMDAADTEKESKKIIFEGYSKDIDSIMNYEEPCFLVYRKTPEDIKNLKRYKITMEETPNE